MMIAPGLKRLLLAALFCLLASTYVIGQSGDSPLTNASIVKLVKAGFKEKTIITVIASRPTRFDLSTEQMIDLKHAGVGEKIILAMLARQQGIDFDAENWEEDPFFNQGNNKPPDNNQSQSGNGTSTEIFGSSGGSRGSSETRGTKGSTQNDTVTTGSATVRIIRPPSEAGTSPKLEKVATLTNESIVELIDAGFSEGTIIRRIEKSPVDFDFSAPKLTELRKHRVTEKIINAMKLAAGEPTETNGTPKTNVKRGL